MTIPNTLLYMLDDDHNVILATSVEEWGAWVENADNRRVDSTELHDGRWVSTMFLGIDHQYGPDTTLRVFETMVFPSKTDMSEEYCERYATWDEAYLGHWRIVRERTLSLCEEVS